MKKASFSVVQGEDSEGTNASISEDEEELQGIDKKSAKQFKYLDKLEGVKIEDDDSEEDATSPKKRPLRGDPKGPSSRILSGLKSASKESRKTLSDSEVEDSEHEENEKKGIKVPREYNPNLFKDLDVDSEIKELFQYITAYMPQQLTLEYKFKPFIPDYIPAVGDIDAFLKVIPPEPILLGERFETEDKNLGLTVLDEPATNQSDPALLLLQLRASSIGVPQDMPDEAVKKVVNVDQNQKVIDKWIKDISDLHKSKSSPIVLYAEPMPDIDDLMQEWPEEMEHRLKEHGFPAPEPDMSTTEYAELVCDLFQIPTGKNIIHSLHLLFSLYAAVKNSKFYQPTEGAGKSEDSESKNDQPDQLVLE